MTTTCLMGIGAETPPLVIAVPLGARSSEVPLHATQKGSPARRESLTKVRIRILASGMGARVCEQARFGAFSNESHIVLTNAMNGALCRQLGVDFSTDEGQNEAVVPASVGLVLRRRRGLRIAERRR